MTYCDATNEVPDNFIEVDCVTRLYIDIVGSTLVDAKPIDQLKNEDLWNHLQTTIGNGVQNAWKAIHSLLPQTIQVDPSTGLPNVASLREHFCKTITTYNSGVSGPNRLFKGTVDGDPRESVAMTCIQYVYNPETGRWEIKYNLNFETMLESSVLNLVPKSFSKNDDDKVKGVLRVSVDIPLPVGGPSTIPEDGSAEASAL